MINNNFYNYNYENDSSSNLNSLDNNSIKLFTCSLCNSESSILKKISIYTNSKFLCINCWNKFYKRLKEIY
jgi:transcription elongation factor Elf1